MENFTMNETYQQLRQLIDAAEEDVQKASEGNKAAGTRVRKTMQDVRELAQTLRKQILEAREG